MAAPTLLPQGQPYNSRKRSRSDAAIPSRKRLKCCDFQDNRSFSTHSFHNVHVESVDAKEIVDQIISTSSITFSTVKEIQTKIKLKTTNLQNLIEEYKSIGIPISDLQPTFNTISELAIISNKLTELIESFNHQYVDQSQSNDDDSYFDENSEDSSSDSMSFLISSEYESDSDSIFSINEYRKMHSKRNRKQSKLSDPRNVKPQIVETGPLNSRYFVIPNGMGWKCPMCTFCNKWPGDNTEVVQCSHCRLRIFKFMYPEIFDIEIDETERNYSTESVSGVSSPELAKRLGIGIASLSEPNISLSLNDIAEYQFVLILGESGSGKSTLLRSLQRQNPNLCVFMNPSDLKWNDQKAVISEFDDDYRSDQRIDLLSSIGLNSVPSWLKPFHILSNGERYRASMARLLSAGLKRKNQRILIDEFTSVLDRANARCIASSISRYIRRHRPNEIAKFVVASSKSDIIPYLQPDAVISLSPNRSHRLLVNPNNLNDRKSYIPDTKVVLDLPPFEQLRQCRELMPDRLGFVDGALYIKNTIAITARARRLRCRIEMDRHTDRVSSVFDIMKHDGDDSNQSRANYFDGMTVTDIPCLERQHIGNKDFSIGLIYGPSGRGKTTTAERLFGSIIPFNWNNRKAICEHFSSLDDMEEKFAACSLSMKLGLSKYHQLSQGERDRVDIAVKLGLSNVLIDEFTSNLDRPTAMRVASGVRDYVHRHQLKNVVVLSCHIDFISILQPDWLFHIENKEVIHYKVKSNRSARSHQSGSLNESYLHNARMWLRPKIRIFLKPTDYWVFHGRFAKYHYMTSDISPAALCFTVWANFGFQDDSNDDDDMECVGFTSFLNHPYSSSNECVDTAFHYRMHRTVILPPFQGMGFASRISDALGLYLSQNGLRLQSKTAHPRYGKSKDRSPLWIPLRTNHQISRRSPWIHSKEDPRYERRFMLKESMKKMFYSHVFKLEYQRTEQEQEYLDQRVIVQNQ